MIKGLLAQLEKWALRPMLKECLRIDGSWNFSATSVATPAILSSKAYLIAVIQGAGSQNREKLPPLRSPIHQTVRRDKNGFICTLAV